jgi:hypothetical protein
VHPPATGILGKPAPAGAQPQVLGNGNAIQRRTNGQVSDVFDKRHDMSVHNGLNGGRTITTLRPDGTRIVTTGARRGFVEKPFTAGGKPFTERTYTTNGMTTHQFYQQTTYQGVPLDVYTPVHYYPPATYGWVYHAPVMTPVAGAGLLPAGMLSANGLPPGAFVTPNGNVIVPGPSRFSLLLSNVSAWLTSYVTCKNPWGMGQLIGSSVGQMGMGPNAPGAPGGYAGGANPYVGGQPGNQGGQNPYTAPQPGDQSGQNPYAGGQQGNQGGQNSYAGGQNPYTAPQPGDQSGQNPYAGGQQGNQGGQNPYAGGQNPYTAPQSGDQSGQNPYAGGQQGNQGGQNPYAGGQNPYTAQQPSDQSGQNPYAGGQQGNQGGQNPYTAPQPGDQSGQNPYAGGQNPYAGGQPGYSGGQGAVPQGPGGPCPQSSNVNVSGGYQNAPNQNPAANPYAGDQGQQGPGQNAANGNPAAPANPYAGDQGQQGPGQNAPGQGAPAAGPVLSPEVQQLVANEIKNQIALENAEAAQNAQGQTPDPASSGVARMLGDGQPHVFVVDTPVDVVDASGAECALGSGDVLQTIAPPAPTDKTASLTVLASNANECALSDSVAVGFDDLQEMQNHMRQTIDQGLNTLEQNQGQSGVPAAPPAAAAATPAPATFAPLAPPPDPNATTEVTQQNQQANQVVSNVAAQAPPQ